MNKLKQGLPTKGSGYCKEGVRGGGEPKPPRSLPNGPPCYLSKLSIWLL